MLNLMEECVEPRKRLRRQQFRGLKQLILSSYGYSDEDDGEGRMFSGRNGATRGVGSEASGQSEPDLERCESSNSCTSTNQTRQTVISKVDKFSLVELGNNCKLNQLETNFGRKEQLENNNSNSTSELEEVENTVEKIMNMLGSEVVGDNEKNGQVLVDKIQKTTNGSVCLSILKNNENKQKNSIYNGVLTNKNGNKKWNYNGLSRDNNYEDISSDEDDFFSQNKNLGASTKSTQINQLVAKSNKAKPSSIDQNKNLDASTQIVNQMVDWSNQIKPSSSHSLSSVTNLSPNNHVTTVIDDDCSATMDTLSSGVPDRNEFEAEYFGEEDEASSTSCDCDATVAEAYVPETNIIVDKALKEFFADEEPDLLTPPQTTPLSLYGRLFNGIVQNETETITLNKNRGVITPVNDTEITMIDDQPIADELNPAPNSKERRHRKRSGKSKKRKDRKKKKRKKIVETREAEVQTIKVVKQDSTNSSSVISKSGKLYTHVIRLGGNPPRFECKNCRRTFKSWDRVRIHAKCKSGEARFVCEVCKTKWHFQSEYSRHFERHMKKKNCPCSVCDEQSNCEFDLYNHMKIHQDAPSNNGNETPNNEVTVPDEETETIVQNDTPNVVDEELLSILEDPPETQETMQAPPPKRGKKGKARAYIRKKRKHQKTEGAFECDKCDKTYRNIHDLKRHIFTHSETPMFKCHLCPKAYKWKSNLTEHMKRDHSALPMITNDIYDHFEYTRLSSTRLKTIRYPAVPIPVRVTRTSESKAADLDLLSKSNDYERESNYSCNSPLGHDVDTESNYSSYVMSNRTCQVNAYRDWRELSEEDEELDIGVEAEIEVEEESVVVDVAKAIEAVVVVEQDLEEIVEEMEPDVESEQDLAEVVEEFESDKEVEQDLEEVLEESEDDLEEEQELEGVVEQSEAFVDVGKGVVMDVKRKEPATIGEARNVSYLEGLALSFSATGLSALRNILSGEIEPYPFFD